LLNYTITPIQHDIAYTTGKEEIVLNLARKKEKGKKLSLSK
jgi:hypothetical protein